MTRRLKAFAPALLLCLGMLPVTAHAATTATATIAIDGTVQGSTLQAAWSGRVSGVSDTTPFDVSWTAHDGALTADLSYSDVDAATGSGSGHGTATAVPGEITGSWWIPGEAFPRAVVGASIVFDIAWQRTGTVATLVMQPESLTLDVAGLGPRTVMTSPLQGIMAITSTTMAAVVMKTSP